VDRRHAGRILEPRMIDVPPSGPNN